MLKRDYLDWWFRPAFLQPWGRPAKALFAGPWIGEFGWELMNWQGFVRKLSRRYETTVVCCQAGNEALYADFAKRIVTHDYRGTAECNTVLEKEVAGKAMRLALDHLPGDADYLKPLGYQPFSRQEFTAYGKARSEIRQDILFHPRGRAFGADRNWDRRKWEELVARLGRNGYRLGCIGLKSATLEISGTYTDFRDLPLGQVMDVLASSRLLIGPSSGPMHLASLCRVPHLVWTDRKRYARGRSNRDKYERWWNPLGTPAVVMDAHGFDPPVDAVLAETERLAPSLKGGG